MNVPMVWMGIWLALDVLRHGAVVVGAPGTGKSVVLKCLRATLAYLIASRPKFDLHLYDFDAKRDLYSIHRLFPDFCPVFDTNPFVWGDKYDPTDDIEDPRDIAELVAQVVDMQANSTQQFFPGGARQVARGTATRHWLVAPGRADFTDYVQTWNSVDGMRLAARSHPLTRPLLALINDTEAGLSIAATLINEVSKFETVAALSRTNTTGRRVSDRGVLAGRFSVNRLPYDDKAIETLAPLTRLRLARVQQLVLADNRPDRNVLLIVDECALLPKVDLTLTAVKGREAGLLYALALQSPTMAREAFGSQAKFDATVSTAKTFVCFQLPDPQDAEWAARRFGSFQAFMRLDSASSSARGGSSSGWSQQFTNVECVTPGMIQALKVPTPADPVTEFYMATVPFRPFKVTLDIPSILSALIPRVPPAAPPRPRDPRDFVLLPPTEADLRRLKLWGV